MTTFLFAVGFALVVSFVCSISEAALLSVTHAQVQRLAGSRSGRILHRFKREIDVPIAAILALNTGANTIGAAMAGASYEAVFGAGSLWPFTFAFTAAILLLSEIIPKTLGAVHTSRVIVPVVYFVSVLVTVMKPVIFVTRGLMRILRGKVQPVTSLEEIRLLAELGKTEGALAERTAKMIEGAARLKELTAYDVMVPRTASVILSGKKNLGENLERIRSSGYSRFPYSREGSADSIDGIVLSRDLLFALHGRGLTGSSGVDENAERVLDSLARSADFVTEQTPLENLLRHFQEKRSHIAVVVDEYGGTGGLVTLEDVLEEIVGEIQDESDRVDPFIVRRADGVLLCRGRAETRVIFDLLGITEEVDSVSVGGLMAERLGRLPVQSDRVRIQSFEFVVQRATQRRVERVLVLPLREDADQDES